MLYTQAVAGIDQCASPRRLRVSTPISSLRYLDHMKATRHPTEPQCSYDPVEGLPIAPDVDPADRIRILEDQICEWTSP